MRFTPDTLSTHLTLDEALARLAASEPVDGLALFGSRAAGSANASAASDYDLLILVRSLPVGVFQVLTHIDGRLTDVVFATHAMVDRLLVDHLPVDGESVSARTNDGRFLLKMATAQIAYDGSGRLARAQDYARRHPPVAEADYPAAYGAWFWLNHSLVHVRRMARSEDPEVLTAADLMLAAGLAEACRAYCLLRAIPWQGEKAALRNMRANDAAHLALVRECLAEADRPRRVALYQQVVAATLAPAGETWQPGLTVMMLDAPAFGTADLDTALNYWESLFVTGQPSASEQTP
jgi:predicted nucleotidyltransferase